MSRRFKRKYKRARVEFKKELFAKCKENRALSMLIIETHVAWHHRRHILRIWSMFMNPSYEEFRNDYTSNLMGNFLTGQTNIWKSLYFVDRELHDKYVNVIPERYAMGDALSVARRALRS